MEIKPCPFCGKPPIVRHDGRPEHERLWIIYCYECTNTYKSEEEAIAAWNRRVGDE